MYQNRQWTRSGRWAPDCQLLHQATCPFSSLTVKTSFIPETDFQKIFFWTTHWKLKDKHTSLGREHDLLKWHSKKVMSVQSRIIFEKCIEIKYTSYILGAEVADWEGIAAPGVLRPLMFASLQPLKMLPALSFLFLIPLHFRHIKHQLFFNSQTTFGNNCETFAIIHCCEAPWISSVLQLSVC